MSIIFVLGGIYINYFKDNFELITYNVVAYFKHLAATQIEKESLNKLLLFAIIIDMKYYIDNGDYTQNELIEYYNDIFNNNKIIIKNHNFSGLFENLDDTILNDCIVSCCLLCMILIFIVDNPDINCNEIEDALYLKLHSIKQQVATMMDDRLYFKDDPSPRILCDYIYTSEENTKSFDISAVDLSLNEYDIKDYDNYDYIDFFSDPFGNGFDRKVITDFLKGKFTYEVLQEEHNAFLNLLKQSKTEMIKSLENEHFENVDYMINNIENIENSKSLTSLAFCYLYGIYVTEDFKKSYELFEKASKLGSNEASFMVSEFYRASIYVKFNLHMYVKYLTIAVSQGSEAAYEVMQRLLFLYSKTIYVEKEVKRLDNKFFGGDFFEKQRKLNDKDIVRAYNKELNYAKSNNEICEWEVINSSKVKKVVDARNEKILSMDCYNLFIEKTNKKIKSYKKYVDNYDQSLRELFETSNCIDEKKKIMTFLNEINSDLTKEDMYEIVELLQGIKNKFGYFRFYKSKYCSDEICEREYEKRNTYNEKICNNKAVFCWYFLLADCGYNNCIDWILKYFCGSNENSKSLKNEYVENFLIKQIHDNSDFNIIKIYDLRNIDRLEELFDNGVSFAYCKLIDIYVENSEYETANKKLKKLLEQCSEIDINTILRNINDYFECSKSTNIYDCIVKKRKNKVFSLQNKDIVSHKKGCYIATCVYESYDCPQVWVLRRYRDEFLNKFLMGRCFIKFYYFISPMIVKWFGKKKWFKNFAKYFLDKKINRLRKKKYSDLPYDDINY